MHALFFRGAEINYPNPVKDSGTDFVDLGMDIVKSVTEVDDTLGPLLFTSYSSSIFFISLALYQLATIYFIGEFRWQAFLFSVYFFGQGIKKR